MSMSEMHDQLRADGHTVIEGYKYLIIDDGEKQEGVDDNGEPVARSANAVTYIPVGRLCQVYMGQTKTEIKNKLRDKTPDMERKKKNEVLDVFNR